jgi:hypothetical protein
MQAAPPTGDRSIYSTQGRSQKKMSEGVEVEVHMTYVFSSVSSKKMSTKFQGG